MVERTSVKLSRDIVEQLKGLKIHPRETYGDVIRRLIEKWKSTE